MWYMLHAGYVCVYTLHTPIPYKRALIYGFRYIYYTNRIWKTKRKRNRKKKKQQQQRQHKKKKSINVNNFSFTLFFRISHWVLFSIEREMVPENETSSEWESKSENMQRACVLVLMLCQNESEYISYEHWHTHTIHAMSNCVDGCVNKSRVWVECGTNTYPHTHTRTHTG